MTAMDNVIPFLTRENDVQIIWLVHQPLRIKNPQDNVKDIHDYPDAKNLLESVRPNCIMVNPTYEPITYSISLAANFLKIPLVCTYLYDHQFTMREESSREYFQYASSLFRRFFAGGVPTDSEEEKRFFGRGRFMIYKYQFLIKTKMILGIDFFSITRELVKDIIMFLSKSNPEYNILADLNLLPNNSWYEPLIKLGFPSKKLSITGNPFWDIRYQKMQQRQSTREQNGKTRVLVLTDALVEHGLWTRDERDLYLTRVLSDLKRENDITFALKIHP
ncbi:MAG: hypothetical protein KGL95_10065, partial [Patescibacteria group bacterium]|nr:hypothetical protein [Patescibacteria group bacterium]